MKAFVPIRWLTSATVVLTMVTVRAGNFSSDFNSGLPSGAAVLGNAFVDSVGGPDGSGCLKLTTASSSQTGTFVLPDLDNGNRIQSFVATFNMHIGNGSTPGADGISFNFGEVPPVAFGEDGIINSLGKQGVSITFDAFDNGSNDDPEGPEVRIRFYTGTQSNTLISRRKLSNQLKMGSGYVPVLIRMNVGGSFDVYLNNVPIYTNLFVVGTGTAGWVFSFGARTGGLYEEHWIDDLNITTVQQIAYRHYVKGATPLTGTSLGNMTNATVQIPLQNEVDTNLTTLLFDGVQVPITWSGVGTGKPVAFYDPQGLPPGSVNTAQLNIVDTNGPAEVMTWTFSITNGPLWTIAPNTRMLGASSEGAAPTCRSLAYSSLSNHVYVASRKGTTTGNIYVLDANTGADLYQLDTSVIVTGANISLLGVAVGDDGAVYAANEVNQNTTPNVNIYRWTTPDSTTPGELIYSGTFATTLRWGDSFAARGFTTNAQFLMDAQNGTFSCLFSTDGSGSWTPNIFSHSYTGAIIGRQITFGPTNTYFLKKKQTSTSTAPLPLNLMTAYTDTPGDQGSATVISSVNEYRYQLGAMSVDISNNIGAGIFFTTNSTSYDRLYLYDLSDPSTPLQIATYNGNLTGNGSAQQCYNFPITHTANANFIGQVIIGGGKIFAIDANNGIIAVPEFPPTKTVTVPPQPQKISVVSSNGVVVISWPDKGAGEVLQANPTLAAGSWANTGLTPVSANGTNSVTITPSGANYYRLAR